MTAVPRARRRPLWVAGLGAGIAGVVGLLAGAYRVRAGAGRVAVVGTGVLRLLRKRAARAAWTLWYESRQRVTRWQAKTVKRGRRWRRRVGDLLRRVPRARAWMARRTRNAFRSR